MRRYVVPGRVELVGKHVDYGGGRSLTCAVTLAVRVTAQPIPERVVRVRQGGSREVVELPIGESAAPTRARWSTYVAAVARRIGRDFPRASGGVDIRLSTTLPPSAGLSSSTALTIALARSVVDATGLTQNTVFMEHAGTPIAFAEYVAAIETGAAFGPFSADEGVGVRGGAQDHVAIMCAREGMVGQFSYMPAREEGSAPWPAGYALAIGVSGVKASKTGNARNAYNRAADALRWLVREWNRGTGRNDATLAEVLASSGDAPERLAAIARDADRPSGGGAATGAHGAGRAPVAAAYLAKRLAQFREECHVIVPGVANALRAGDLAAMGALVDRSQSLAERALENQVPETIHLARAARELGAAAASSFGAGFGGAVWAMVPRDGADGFLERWRRRFAQAFPARAAKSKFLLTDAGPPAGSEVFRG